MEIRFISNHEIDPIKWDHCIKESVGKLIYAEYAYLQHMSPRWEALVCDDYEIVLPVTYNRKWGFLYAYQPAFTQQTGIFSSLVLNEDKINLIMLSLISKYPFIEIHLPAYLQQFSFPNSRFYNRNNFILQLHTDYETIASSYNSNLRQRVNKSLRNGLTYEVLNDPEEAINIYRQLNEKKIGGFSASDYDRFIKLCAHYHTAGRVLLRGVRDTVNGQLLACVLLLKDEKRIYNMASSLYPEGKKLLANYFLYDQLIREFSGQDLLLDFEGSDVPGIAAFYNRFPVQPEPYCLFRHNHLPIPFKWFKPRA